MSSGDARKHMARRNAFHFAPVESIRTLIHAKSFAPLEKCTHRAVQVMGRNPLRVSGPILPCRIKLAGIYPTLGVGKFRHFTDLGVMRPRNPAYASRALDPPLKPYSCMSTNWKNQQKSPEPSGGENVRFGARCLINVILQFLPTRYHAMSGRIAFC